MNVNLTVGFIGSNISKALSGEVVGGAEKQQALIIEGLKSKGLNVVVIEYYLNEPKVVNGIKIYPAWNNNRKTFLAKLWDLQNIFKELNVNVVYIRGTQMYGAMLYLLIKFKNSGFNLIWGLAGDHDLTSKYNYLRVKTTSSWYARINAGMIFNLSSMVLFYFSDTIICQTTEQLKKCKIKSKKKSAVLISNIYTNYSKNDKKQTIESTYDAIWVGKFSGIKGEDILLRISKDIPNMKIMCLGPVANEFKKSKTYQQIKDQDNLILTGRVAYKEVENYISKADFVLNTSPSEGLSNVFLEGWNKKKPVISLAVNPNEYLTKGEAGFCAQNSYLKLITKLNDIRKNTEFMNYHGNKGKEILKNHLPEIILHKYYNLFLNK